MDVTTRAATPDDAYAIARAHVRAWQVGYRQAMPESFLDGLDVKQRAQQWYQNLTEDTLPDGTPAPVNFVAEVDRQVVGFACVGVWRLDRENAKLGELWAMYVHPDQWGTGAGYALMGATLDHFRRAQIDTGYLWVLEDNDRARQFYERQGWRADDVTQIETIADTAILERRYSIVV